MSPQTLLFLVIDTIQDKTFAEGTCNPHLQSVQYFSNI